MPSKGHCLHHASGDCQWRISLCLFLRWGDGGPEKEEPCLVPPLSSKLGGWDCGNCLSLAALGKDQILLSSPQGAPHHHSTGQWGQQAGGSLKGGSLATILPKTQPAANLPPATSSLHFSVSKQTPLSPPTPSSQSLSFLSSGRGQNGYGARAVSGCGWGAGYHPLFQDLTSALWDQAPIQMGRLCGLRSAGTRPRPQRGSPQHELPSALGHWPQEGGPGGRGQDLGLQGGGGQWLL